MTFDQSQPGCDWLPIEIVAHGQCHTDHRLQTVQHRLYVGLSRSYLCVAVFAWFYRQVIRLNFLPKCLVIKRLKPLLNIVNVIESSHFFRLPGADSELQLKSVYCERNFR